MTNNNTPIFNKEDIKCLIELADDKKEKIITEIDKKSKVTDYFNYYQDRYLELDNIKEKLLYYYKLYKLHSEVKQ